MLFNTIEFWLFFFPVLFLVYLLPHRGQNRVLLAASYVFYAAWDWRFLSLLLISTCADFVLAKAAAPGRTKDLRKIALTGSLLVNLGLLGFFKYHDFFVDSFTQLFGLSGEQGEAWLLHLVLPVGISFYTFQTLSYTIDVYRGRIRASDSLLDFALYVSFFPQLVAGPIERGAHFLPQVTRPRKIDPDQLESGALLIIWGLFKKVVIADTLAHPVNAVFADPSSTGPEIYCAAFCFAWQIYCDFSGYTDIARGIARLMGFTLMENFNLPYLARNPADFWRRWHISLSTWLRDYLYISLGGNRKGRLFTYRNLMITMLLGGLWHGARLNFVIWGLYHGLILILHRIFTKKTTPSTNRLIEGLGIVGMFHLTMIGWLIFRAESTEQMSHLLAGLGRGWQHWESAGHMLLYAGPYLLPLLVMQAVQWKSGKLEVINRAPWPLRAFFFGSCLASVCLLNQSSGTPFIYFQF